MTSSSSAAPILAAIGIFSIKLSGWAVPIVSRDSMGACDAVVAALGRSSVPASLGASLGASFAVSLAISRGGAAGADGLGVEIGVGALAAGAGTIGGLAAGAGCAAGLAAASALSL